MEWPRSHHVLEVGGVSMYENSHGLGKCGMSSHIQLHLVSWWAKNTQDLAAIGEVTFCLDGHHTLPHVPLA